MALRGFQRRRGPCDRGDSKRSPSGAPAIIRSALRAMQPHPSAVDSQFGGIPPNSANPAFNGLAQTTTDFTDRHGYAGLPPIFVLVGFETENLLRHGWSEIGACSQAMVGSGTDFPIRGPESTRTGKSGPRIGCKQAPTNHGLTMPATSALLPAGGNVRSRGRDGPCSGQHAGPPR